MWHSISQEICTRFCCALLCCGYAIVFIMNSHEVFIHIHQGCFAGTGAIIRLPQCQWSKPDGYGKISQCITTTKHSKAKTVCIFLGIYCRSSAGTMMTKVKTSTLTYDFDSQTGSNDSIDIWIMCNADWTKIWRVETNKQQHNELCRDIMM